MTKDYAKPSTTRKPSSSKKKPSKRAPARSAPKTASKAAKAKTEATSTGHAKYIVLMVVVVGLFIYGLYYLATIPPEQLASQSQRSAPVVKETKKTSKAVTQPKTQKQPEARFKFYDLLPNTEVESSTVDAYKFKEKGEAEQYLYVLQTGSFKSARDAERQKATIAFQGLKAKIKTITNASGTTWHRVETGPYTSRSKMNAALDKLVAIHIQPLVKKTKK